MNTYNVNEKNINFIKLEEKKTLFINEDKHITGKNAKEINFQLQEIAKKALRDKNKKEVKANLRFLGLEKLLSVGDTIYINDFGNFLGNI